MFHLFFNTLSIQFCDWNLWSARVCTISLQSLRDLREQNCKEMETYSLKYPKIYVWEKIYLFTLNSEKFLNSYIILFLKLLHLIQLSHFKWLVYPVLKQNASTSLSLKRKSCKVKAEFTANEANVIFIFQLGKSDYTQRIFM